MRDVTEWLRENGGIAHRAVALDEGFTAATLRAAVRSGSVERVRAVWLALPDAPAHQRAAARAGGRVACVTVARERGWWMPEHVDDRLHLALRPHARSDGLSGHDGTVHWTEAIAPASRYDLDESVEDALAHVAVCLDREQALVVWESAARREGLDPAALRGVRWTTAQAAWCAQNVNGVSDSGLETVFAYRFTAWGVPFRQQVFLAGRPVDALIGERLVVQIDGHAYHSSAADRARDVAHDAELRLRGYTVLRFTYAQIIHDWTASARVISRALAAGAHLAGPLGVG